MAGLFPHWSVGCVSNRSWPANGCQVNQSPAHPNDSVRQPSCPLVRARQSKRIADRFERPSRRHMTASLQEPIRDLTNDSPNALPKRNLDSVESWIESYFESLTKADTATGQTEALAIKRSNFPPALYRYRSLEHLAYTLEVVEVGRLAQKYVAFTKFPYDSALSISWGQAWKQAIEEIPPEYRYDPKFVEPLEEKQSEYEQQAFESLVGGLLSVSYGPSASPDLFSRFRKTLVGVSCFATNPTLTCAVWSRSRRRSRARRDKTGPRRLNSPPT